MSGWTIAPKSGSKGTSLARRAPTLLLVDLGIFLILVAAPFLMGGRQAAGQLALCVLSVATALAWCCHQWLNGDARWKFTGTEPLILLGLGLIFLQCWQLSPEIISVLSPKISQLLPEWTQHPDALQLPGPWRRISFTPSDTWSNFVIVTAGVLFFFVLVQRLRTLDDVYRILRFLAIAGVLMSCLALAQLFIGNGRFFWLYEHPRTPSDTAAKGAFSNANHFANFAAMSLAAQLSLLVQRFWAQNTPRSKNQWRGATGTSSVLDPQLLLWGASLCVTLLALLLSFSRGGILVASGGGFLMLVVIWKKRLLSTRMAMAMIATAIGALVVLVMSGEKVLMNVENNFAELTTADFEQLDQKSARRDIWAANLEGIRQFPIVGTGLGSHREVYWLWFNHPHRNMEYSHAECGYLQIALETGLAGLGIVLLLWMIALLWCAQGLWHATNPRISAAVAAVCAGLMISLAHSVTDFVWYCPACVNVVLAYAVCAWRISLMRFNESGGDSHTESPPMFSFGRFGWAAMIAPVLFLGIWMVREKVPEVAGERLWDEYLRVCFAEDRNVKDEFSMADSLRERKLALATAAAAANPRSHRAQLHAGLACLRRFVDEQQRNSGSTMPLSQIREAALSSFQSFDEMQEWLEKPGVLGEARKYLVEAAEHFRASLIACPLQPRPYLELAELVWLQGAPEESERQLIEQALVARPYDARSHFTIGKLLWLEGSQAEALHHWQEAFRLDPEYRGHLIEALAVYVPANFFLDNFHPDLDSLMQLKTVYKESQDQNGYRQVIDQLAKASVKRALASDALKAERHWMLAHQCFVELGDRKSAYLSAKEAIDANPSSFQAHQRLGTWLYQNGVYREAVEHLTWCYRRRPDMEALHRMAQKALVEAERAEGRSPVAELPSESIRR